MTIENIDTSFINEAITAMDVAGFRIFLRHHIYNSVDDTGEFVHTQIVKNIEDAIGKAEYSNDNIIAFNSNKVVNVDESNASIIDIIREYLYTKCSNRILYEINYSPSLTQHEKNAYKKILFEMSRSRLYFDLLLNISYALPTIVVML